MKRISLAAVPSGVPKSSDFRVDDVAEPQQASAGGLLVRTLYISVDPYLRGRISGRKTYIDPILPGQPMVSGAVGEVIESDHPKFARGQVVTGTWPWQEVVTVAGEGTQVVPKEVQPVSLALGILGMTGMTAYFGLREICAPKPGETVLVSGAAGAVGSAVGQIAKILGCRVVGTAGSEDKIHFIRQLGFDGALNYRAEGSFVEPLRSLCPNGIDCYFDNVGGEVTDAAFEIMNTGARVAVCGQISMYNDPAKNIGQRPFSHMILKQIKAEGFLVFRWLDRYAEGQAQMAGWLRDGKLQYRETVYEGIESAIDAFAGLFTGDNTGKAVVKL